MHIIILIILIGTFSLSAYASKDDLGTCVAEASLNYGVPQRIIKSIMRVEGGKVGMETINRDSSFDLGIMQINDSQPWFRVLEKAGFDRELLINNGCANIWGGTFILASEIYSAKEFWKGVANYHNRREPYHSQYLTRVKKAWVKVGEQRY